MAPSFDPLTVEAGFAGSVLVHRYGRHSFRAHRGRVFASSSRLATWRPRQHPVTNMPHTCSTEMRQFTEQRPRTVMVSEDPRAEGDPHDPVPRDEHRDCYNACRHLADEHKVAFVGWLATYRYHNVDQAVAQAKVLGAAGRLRWA